VARSTTEVILRKKPAIWSIAAFLGVICCVAATLITLWQFPPTPVDLLLTEAIETATATPIPIIERTPVITLPASPPTSAEIVAATPSKTSQAVLDTATSTVAPPSPTVEREAGQASPLQPSTEEVLTQAILPERDQRLLASRLKHKGEDIPKTAANPRNNFQLGDSDNFWVTDNAQTPPAQFQVKANVRYITDHSYWWIQEGFNVNAEDLKRSAERFETQTYPTNRAFFGSEWSPGVDNDIRIHIFIGNVPGAAGYFSASNSYSKLAEPYSNEREMFFINLNAVSPGSDYFDSVLAHEFQHMIHWRQDRNEDTWVNEGLSELATFINGYGPSSFVGTFLHVPDTQLNSWASAGASPPHYGGSFLFMAYFLQRYGEEMTQAVVANTNNGITGFNAVLMEHGYSQRFQDIFAAYLAANYLQNSGAGNGLWGYQNLPIDPLLPTERYGVYPVEQQATVYQYGGDYIELTGNGNLTIEFTGSTRVKVINNQAHSGQYQWYSHRGDETNTHLTRAFDLRNVTQATLHYWTWYDIEPDWDYGYVEISTDGGQTWTILQTPNSSTSNPTGSAFGPGYTGASGAGPAWLEEQLDLSPYTGQEVLIRFEYVTDDAVNRPGWTIDDVSIPEINFYDDIENGPNGWQAEGFVRIDNVLPQRFSVQLLEVGAEVKVRPLSLDQTNYGTITVAGLGSTLERAVLVISGLTPVTTEPASYQYKISQ
jgi:hypothetical protein